MTFYQELQLSSTGSKQLIRSTTDPKEKRRHILIYNFKVYLVMAFCVAVVSMYSKLTGSSNSVVGVTVLLAVLVLRQADFGIRTTHGLLSIAGIFGILMAGFPEQIQEGSSIGSVSLVLIEDDHTDHHSHQQADHTEGVFLSCHIIAQKQQIAQNKGRMIVHDHIMTAQYHQQ